MQQGVRKKTTVIRSPPPPPTSNSSTDPEFDGVQTFARGQLTRNAKSETPPGCGGEVKKETINQRAK